MADAFTVSDAKFEALLLKLYSLHIMVQLIIMNSCSTTKLADRRLLFRGLSHQVIHENWKIL